jgi:hypothetical protein
MILHVGSMMDLTRARGTLNASPFPHLQQLLSILILDPGKSPSPTAASFIRTTRLKDREQSFVEAIHEKYAASLAAESTKSEEQIEISGKVVEEVGFDKIRQQQARLHELKIVLVDGMRIKEPQIPGVEICQICPKIVELDLSRNLFENFVQIADIAAELVHLRKLRLK